MNLNSILQNSKTKENKFKLKKKVNKSGTINVTWNLFLINKMLSLKMNTKTKKNKT